MNKIIQGDSLKVLKKLEDESVDMICTDPPYGYSFMAKDWDKAVPRLRFGRNVSVYSNQEDSVSLCLHREPTYKVRWQLD